MPIPAISGELGKPCIMDTTVHNLKFEINKTCTEHDSLFLFDSGTKNIIIISV